MDRKPETLLDQHMVGGQITYGRHLDRILGFTQGCLESPDAVCLAPSTAARYSSMPPGNSVSWLPAWLTDFRHHRWCSNR